MIILYYFVKDNTRLFLCIVVIHEDITNIFYLSLFSKNLVIKIYFITFALLNANWLQLSDSVTGNTSGFGPEESRFEP